MTVEQIVAIALEANPQVRAARARWNGAKHAVRQNYAPADPTFTYGSFDSPTNGLDHASAHAMQSGVAFQFPGKALLQAESAKRAADIARLTYEAAVRDVRARTQVQFYQFAIDTALAENVSRTIRDLERFMAAIRTGPAAKYASAIRSDLADARQRERSFEIARADDKSRLNELLNRRPNEPLEVEAALDLVPVSRVLDELIERAWSKRQEILQLALQERNAETALTLAKLEYAPDYTVGYSFNHYLLPSDAPGPGLNQTHSVWASFNLPLFFWTKQAEDVKRAAFDLEAAREDLSAVRNRTAVEVTILFRHADFDYRNAITYRDVVVPQSLEAFDAALADYRNHGEQFATLSHLRNQLNLARATLLGAVNSFIADRIALEQEINEPLGK